MRGRLRCQMHPGQFNSELVAVIQSANGREYSLFAQKTDLEFDEIPGEDKSVTGWVHVEIVDRQGGQSLVRLPATTIESGQFLTVFAEQLQTVPSQDLEVAQ